MWNKQQRVTTDYGCTLTENSLYWKTLIKGFLFKIALFSLDQPSESHELNHLAHELNHSAQARNLQLKSRMSALLYKEGW